MVNWLTTLGGVLAAMGSAGATLAPEEWRWVFAVFFAPAGLILLGASAKDARTHSTAEEVHAATVKENQEKIDKLGK